MPTLPNRIARSTLVIVCPAACLAACLAAATPDVATTPAAAVVATAGAARTDAAGAAQVGGTAGTAARTTGAANAAAGAAAASADNAGSGGSAASTSEGLLALAWRDAWIPSAGEAWREHWFLDGAAGRVVPTARGFELRAGPAEAADAGHTVLWTRRGFKGDLRVDFRYTRLDDAGPGRNGVNILYFHAQGSGKAPYESDIHAWRALRDVAAMKWYFEHMDAYHISFSAYSRAESTDQDYVRFRRYMPERGKGLAGTEVLPTYHAPELFRTGVPYAFTLIRRGEKICLMVRDERGGAARVFAWDASSMPLLEAGRIGLRHMAGRASLYEDFRVRFGAER